MKKIVLIISALSFFSQQLCAIGEDLHQVLYAFFQDNKLDESSFIDPVKFELDVESDNDLESHMTQNERMHDVLDALLNGSQSDELEDEDDIGGMQMVAPWPLLYLLGYY